MLYANNGGCKVSSDNRYNLYKDFDLFLRSITVYRKKKGLKTLTFLVDCQRMVLKATRNGQFFEFTSRKTPVCWHYGSELVNRVPFKRHYRLSSGRKVWVQLPEASLGVEEMFTMREDEHKDYPPDEH
ncbi:hypothetical protein PIROE2DRAFT_1601 [Piromyces sp. E2]|nr:hypothetical protein PIROE2DRAFT_1601 [Piromyces sp. E2]|eukprot:OUM70200.1 hypothetical protein PIROE2DRAFT_1601 [Piromyces sp. E2]